MHQDATRNFFVEPPGFESRPPFPIPIVYHGIQYLPAFITLPPPPSQNLMKQGVYSLEALEKEFFEDAKLLQQDSGLSPIETTQFKETDITSQYNANDNNTDNAPHIQTQLAAQYVTHEKVYTNNGNNDKYAGSPRSNVKKKGTNLRPKSLNVTPEKPKQNGPHHPQTEVKYHPRSVRYQASKIHPNRKLTPEIARAISSDIVQLYDSLVPGAHELVQRADLVQRLSDMTSEAFSANSPSFHVYGSSANGLLCKRADLDICFKVDRSAGTDEEVLNKLGEKLSENNMKNVMPLLRARCPIVKFKDPKTNILCDICLNNDLAILNTKLLADYMSIDDRARKLAVCIKYWAKRRKINETYEGFLSSYAYVIMLINFLQRRKPPILPCLQQLRKLNQTPDQTRHEIDGFDCYYYLDISSLKDFGTPNTESLGELMVAFFRLYAHFQYKDHVISIRTMRYLEKKEKEWAVRTGNQRTHSFFTLEDPFEITHNLARNTDYEQLKVLRSEFSRSYSLLVTGAKFSQVCANYNYNEK